jgi:hypothetical protein
MKRLLLILLVTAIALPAFQSCKKGENDPAISLKSRKARLVGEWKLTEGSRTSISGSTSNVYTYNGSTCTTSGSGTPFVYMETIKVNKDGTFERTLISGSETTTDKGQWYFLDGNKDKKIKNKECVSYVVTSSITTSSSGSSTYTYSGVSPDEIVQLDRLSSKEMIVLWDENSTYSSSSYSYKGTMTYEKQ